MRWRLIGALLLVFGSTNAVQQSSRPLFSSTTELVVLHVTVTDRRGAYVTGLPLEAFTVFEEGQPQAIGLFTAEDAPVSIGLIVDDSGSMLPNRDGVIAAASAFVDASNREDEVFALAFDETVRAALPASAPFTGDVPTLREALVRVLRARGRTALFDAITAGLDYVGEGRYERKALVLVSDGGDNASRATLADALTRTQASNVLIYTVALVDPAGHEGHPKVLKQIARATGGESFTPSGARDIAHALTRIANEIRHAYTLGYVSTNQSRDGTFRTLRLTVRSSAGEKLDVRTRTGYLAGRQGTRE